MVRGGYGGSNVPQECVCHTLKEEKTCEPQSVGGGGGGGGGGVPQFAN